MHACAILVGFVLVVRAGFATSSGGQVPTSSARRGRPPTQHAPRHAPRHGAGAAGLRLGGRLRRLLQRIPHGVRAHHKAALLHLRAVMRRDT